MVRVGIAVTSFAAGLWLVYLALSGTRAAVAEPLNTSGHEAPITGALFSNGWNVADISGVGFRAFYERWRDLFGEPTTGFDGLQQCFTFACLRVNPANPPDWRIEIVNAGQQAMLAEGWTPTPGRTPHRAVRDWVLHQLELGVDVPRLVGRFISEPVCQKKLCRQFSEKQLFVFGEDATSFDEVRREPVGLWLSHPRSREPQVNEDRSISYPLLALGVVLLAVALGSVAIRPGRSGDRFGPM
jgi:hypothetical protein